MKTLVVEDDFTSRKLLQGIFAPLGDCDVAVNGKEAIQAFQAAWAENRPYDLICLDIMMPDVDGHEALKVIRSLEKNMGVDSALEAKVIMVTALGDPKNVVEAYYKGGANSYVVKPIDKRKLIEEVKSLGLLR